MAKYYLRLVSKSATILPARQTRTVPSDSLTVKAMHLVLEVIPAAAACLDPSPDGNPSLNPASGRFHDPVAPNDDGPVNRREFADRFPHCFIQNVAILLRITLERIEDHLF